jgi:hypothetical protein
VYLRNFCPQPQVFHLPLVDYRSLLFKERAEYPKEEIDLEKLISMKPKSRPENALLHAGTGVLKVFIILTELALIWRIDLEDRGFQESRAPRESARNILFGIMLYLPLC